MNASTLPSSGNPASLRPDPAALFARRASVTGVAGAMLLGGTALAQQPAATATTTAATPMDEVVVTAERETPFKPEQVASPRYPQPLLDTPRTVTVVPQEVIEAQNATTIQQALRNVPGISMQAGEGGGGNPGDNLSIRGFNAGNDFFVDGVRDLGNYSRDPFNYEQIEVVKGPGSTDFGRGSTGGSINLVTKTPKSEAFYNAAATVGTDNLYRGTLDLNQPLNVWNGALRLNLVGQSNDVPGRDHVEQERWGIAPSLTFGLGTDTVTTLSWLHLEQDNISDYGIPFVPATHNILRSYRDEIAPVSYDNWYGLANRDYEDITTDIVTGEVRHAVNDNFDIRGLLRYGRTHRDSIITAPRFVSDDTTDIRRTDWKSRDQVDEIFAAVLDANIRFDTGSLGHTVVTGVDYTQENSDLRGRTTNNGGPDTDLYSPSAGSKNFGSFFGDGNNLSGEAETIGAFVYDTVELNEQWSINGGARYDHLEYSSDGADVDFSRTEDLLSWRAGVVYKPVDNGSIYAAYGTSFNPASETIVASGRSTADIGPEENRTFEVGTKWELMEERLGLTLAAFQIDKTNARTPGDGPNDPPLVLDGEQRIRGIEFGATGQITDNFRVFGGYTFLDSEILSANDDTEGNELPHVPAHTFSLWSELDITEKLTLGAGARYVGSRYNSTANTREADGYVLFDAALSYAFTDQLSAHLNVYNIGDERYLDSLSGGHAIPGAGRSASVTLRYEF